ncbi:MAG: hypothetical protein P1Q69_07755 [Candidatus Thorarchaeota archaeon]|nr:hypothetical protein [Candidatus Thorarchaeota archaeon]
MQSMDVFMQYVTEPISLLSQGLTGLILFVGAHVFWIWSNYQVVIRLSNAAAALLDAFDQELSQIQYMSGPKYNVFLALMRYSLILVVLIATYFAMGLFVSFFPGPETIFG